jgi:hypothetical protein
MMGASQVLGDPAHERIPVPTPISGVIEMIPRNLLLCLRR